MRALCAVTCTYVHADMLSVIYVLCDLYVCYVTPIYMCVLCDMYVIYIYVLCDMYAICIYVLCDMYVMYLCGL